MKKNVLDRKFQHHKWFKEGVTVREALDYFAKSGDFYLSKKPVRKSQTEMRLSTEEEYEDVLRYVGLDRSTYRLNTEEKSYFLERVEHWKQEKVREHNEWLAQSVELDKELRNYLAGNSNYNIEIAEKQIHHWKYVDPDSEAGKISFWEREKKRRLLTRSIINDMIKEMKEKIKTNEDFVKFKELISEEIDSVQYWDGDQYRLREDIA